MADFLLELLSEEIPARMQEKARADLARLLAEALADAGLKAEAIETFATPRRLALIARGLPQETAAVSEELKGPRTSAPPQALDGFLRKTGLTQDQLVERDGIWFAQLDKPGRATAAVLAEAIPIIIRAFPWPKSMRWGEASASTESLRWVRPLHGIVALLGEEIVECEVAGVRAGAATVGHRFHHPGAITIGGAHDYVEKLRACHVIVDADERKAIIRDGARAAAEGAGLSLIADEPLVAENAGLTEWPVPLLGRFDPEFLDVPPEIIQLTARVNQKYFVCNPPRDGEGDHAEHGGGGAGPGDEPPPSALRAATSPSRGGLADAFVCVANLDAADGGERIVEGNRKVLAARLADARFFWEQDLKVPLADQAAKLSQIVFHEKLGTVADKVERVAKLARWLVEEGIVGSSPERGGGPPAQPVGEGSAQRTEQPLHQPAAGPPPRSGEELAALAERAARLCKADLVTGLVGEFPELQGVIGGHLARAQGEPPEIADAVRDHYKPVGQGDEIPTAPVTVAVSLADKLDTLIAFFTHDLKPTGSKDPFALRRCALGVVSLLVENCVRIRLGNPAFKLGGELLLRTQTSIAREALKAYIALSPVVGRQAASEAMITALDRSEKTPGQEGQEIANMSGRATMALLDFFADRLKVQQREAGVRHDLIDAVFALGGEDDLVRLLARVKALQAFVETSEGADLLAGYKRAANILKKEGWPPQDRHPELVSGSMPPDGGEVAEWMLKQVQHDGDREAEEQSRNKPLSYTPEKEEGALIAALDSAEPAARAAVEAEDFEAAMRALASLRAPVDAFFDKVTVNDADPDKRAARLGLLSRMRDAVHQVADFSRIEG